MYLPLPPTETANNKFKSRLQTLYQIKRVVSDHNYLVEKLQSSKRQVVHHDLCRYVSPLLAKKLEGYKTELGPDLEPRTSTPNTSRATGQPEEEPEDDDVILANVDVKDLVRGPQERARNSQPRQVNPEDASSKGGSRADLEWDTYQAPGIIDQNTPGDGAAVVATEELTEETTENAEPSTAQRRRTGRRTQQPDRYGDYVYY